MSASCGISPFKCGDNGKIQMIDYFKFCLLKLERNLFFFGEKDDSVVEAGICRIVSRTQNVPKIKYTETNINQRNSSHVSCRLRRLSFMMKCS